MNNIPYNSEAVWWKWIYLKAINGTYNDDDDSYVSDFLRELLNFLLRVTYNKHLEIRIYYMHNI